MIFLFGIRYIRMQKTSLLQELKSVEQVKNKCLFVLDTNALLLPYTTSSKSIDEIKKVYAKLIKEKRLFIPGQVAREFAKNRPEKIKDYSKS